MDFDLFSSGGRGVNSIDIIFCPSFGPKIGRISLGQIDSVVRWGRACALEFATFLGKHDRSSRPGIIKAYIERCTILGVTSSPLNQSRHKIVEVNVKRCLRGGKDSRLVHPKQLCIIRSSVAIRSLPPRALRVHRRYVRTALERDVGLI